jgi:hypothetical protein
VHQAYLIDLRFIAFALQINLLDYAGPTKHMVAASNPFLETHAGEQLPEVIEWYVSIRSATQYLKEKFIVITHQCGRV